MKKIALSTLNDEISILVMYGRMTPEARKTLLAFARSLVEPMEQPPLPGVAEEFLTPFWNFYDAHADLLNHARKNGVIAINLPQFIEVAAAHRQQLPPVSDLTKLFRQSRIRPCRGMASVRSKLLNRVIRCWFFEKGGNYDAENR